MLKAHTQLASLPRTRASSLSTTLIGCNKSADDSHFAQMCLFGCKVLILLCDRCRFENFLRNCRWLLFYVPLFLQSFTALVVDG